MPYERAELSTREQQMVAKLADACRLMDELFWHQSDQGGWAVYRVTQSPVLAKLFGVMGSRWDLLDDNFPFLGEEPMPPGHELYPYGLSREQVDRFAATHPEMKDALFDEHTVVRGTPDHLLAIPYHEAYAEWLRPMAADLRAAAELSPDPGIRQIFTIARGCPALRRLLCQRHRVARSQESENRSDLRALRNLSGRTARCEDLVWRGHSDSQSGAKPQAGRLSANEAAMQQALPLPDADKPSKQGQATPMEVVDSPLRAGDLRYGYQAVADNLPNDARIHAEKGTKKIFFKNFMDARVNDGDSAHCSPDADAGAG